LDKRQDFKTLSDQARIKPPTTAWDKLEEKLDHDVKYAKKERGRLMSYLMNTAAIAIIFLACIFIYQETQQDLTISKGNIAEWEELEVASDKHYDVTRLHALNTAYKS